MGGLLPSRLRVNKRSLDLVTEAAALYSGRSAMINTGNAKFGNQPTQVEGKACDADSLAMDCVHCVRLKVTEYNLYID
jgi:hypothetical protein